MTRHAKGSNIQIPEGPMVTPQTGMPTPAWYLWLTNPNVQTLDIGNPLAITNGGTGKDGGPLDPDLNPILTGDVTCPGGTTVTTLATVNGSPGTFGDGTHTGTFTVTGKGLITSGSATAITGAPGSFTVTGAFGCNTKSAQSAYASGGAVSGTGSTNTVPWGYSTQAQADGIVTLLNNIRAALVNCGIMS
jgi:hypothetical protein